MLLKVFPAAFPLEYSDVCPFPALISLSLACAFYPNIRGVFMNVDLVDYPASPKFSMVPLFRNSESRLAPLLSFCLFDKIVFGVAFESMPVFVFELALFENGLLVSRPALESRLAVLNWPCLVLLAVFSLPVFP